MNILITDDETPARIRLRALVEELGHKVVGEAAHGEQALQISESQQPDAILLDIRMPGMDGIETARHLMGQENPPAVIFVTAYDQHALQAFETNAIDYLLKPIRKERLQEALQKAGRLNRVQLSRINQDDANARTHICVRARNQIRLIALPDIIYFMADQKYISVATAEGEVLIEESLKSLEEEFSARFIRIHRNALVARDYIMLMDRTPQGGHLLKLRDTQNQLEVSRRHVSEVRKIIKNLG